jgi:hypothetical protein
MRLGYPIQALHSALAQALHRDLPDIEYKNRDWPAYQKMTDAEKAQAMRTNTVPQISVMRRPREDDVEVIMFPQTWGSTALGYGGMGGASVTSAYTVIVSNHVISCVYFGEGELAYRINHNTSSAQGRENWRKDVADHRMQDRAQAHARYQTT